jgi:hypothetical protein
MSIRLRPFFKEFFSALLREERSLVVSATNTVIFQWSRNGHFIYQTVAQWLKPHSFQAAYGTAEAVPFQNE